jgi:hypothetical protein
VASSLAGKEGGSFGLCVQIATKNVGRRISHTIPAASVGVRIATLSTRTDYLSFIKARHPEAEHRSFTSLRTKEFPRR